MQWKIRASLRQWVLIAIVLLVAIGFARFGLSLTTIDYYYGKIPQQPKVGATGEREISLLAPSEKIAETINVTDFCLMPFTKYCRYNSADVHNTFVVGDSYCVTALGWRFGLLSWKPNLVEIVDPDDPDFTDCPTDKG